MYSTSQQSSPHKRRGVFATLLVSIVLLGASLFVALNPQYISDMVRFWTYEPTSQIGSIASDIQFTDNGKFLFYASRPVVADSQSFNQSCDRKEQNTAIIGCYVNDTIYVYDVTNDKLDGVKEVTAAHEMLHAVYQRLSLGEKEEVNQLVETEYAKLSVDPAYAERMAFYARTEPGERDNELHSIIGTELSSIDPKLETHYARYFKDRSKIVAYYNKYNGAFKQLKEQSETLAAQLDALSKKIESDKAAYGAEVAALNADIEEFKRRDAANDFDSVAKRNAELVALKSRIAATDKKRDTVIAAIQSEVGQYNELVNEYNATQIQSQELFKSIDSTVVSAPSV